MRIREAILQDKMAWDLFVDNEGGSFYLYFDWKHVHETAGRQFIPLLVETDSSQLVGIFPVVKEKRLLYSVLSGRFALRKDLTAEQSNEAISALLRYVDAHHSKGSSTFNVVEHIPLDGKFIKEGSPVLIDNGYRLLYDKSIDLPCVHFLELKQPFEQAIWKGLWSSQLRQVVRKVMRNGVVVVEDKDLNYVDYFVETHNVTLGRHAAKLVTKSEIMAELDAFREKSKLFVALLNDQPIVALLCHYTSSTCYLCEVGTYAKDSLDANKLCWKTAIEDACNAGYRFAEFGCTPTSSLAFFKERFEAARIPWMTYEKRYSIPRTLLEKWSIVMRHTWQDKGYIWRNRRMLWDRIFRG